MQGWKWKNFAPDELRCHCLCQELVFNNVAMERLQTMRDKLGFHLIITSAYRCPTHNKTVSSTGLKGPHTTARAFDIQIWGDYAIKVMEAAIAEGFTGFGLMQHGPRNKRFLHLDDLVEPDHSPRPWVWTYKGD